MSAEYVAERLLDGLPVDFAPITPEPWHDLRTGGSFFDIQVKGKRYEVLVQEVRQ